MARLLFDNFVTEKGQSTQQLIIETFQTRAGKRDQVEHLLSRSQFMDPECFDRDKWHLVQQSILYIKDIKFMNLML